MELKAGYKQTEVGVIPEDWSVKELGDFDPFVTSGSRGWAEYYSRFGEPFIRITNLSREWLYPSLDDLRFVSLPKTNSEGARTQLRDGDLLISITADIGIIGYVDARIPKPAYINQHIALARLDASAVNSKYTGYFLASANGQALFRALTDSGAKAGMNLSTVRKILGAFPPSLAEQQAIAEALSDADALIESLEQLLTKKRQIRQGTMQELLSGKKRLPGFSDKWDVRSFDDVLVRVNAKRHQLPSTLYQVSGRYSVVDQGQEPVVAYSDQGDNVFPCPAGGVIVFGDHTCIVKFVDFDFLVGADGTQLLLGKARQCTRFHAYQLQCKGVQPTGYNRHFKFLKEREFLVPKFAEQVAIATILSDIDAELAALNAKLDKARFIKQGMMQELLTGRIRLV